MTSRAPEQNGPRRRESEAGGLICIDTTLLRFSANMRGIPQVLFVLLEVLAAPPFKGRARFLAYGDVAEKHLIPRGIPPEAIVLVPEVPWLGRWERFHLLFTTLRYRRATRGASLLIHPEPRSVTRLPLTQIVIWHDFFQFAGTWLNWRKPSRYLLTVYKYRIAVKRALGITNSEYTRQKALRVFPGADPASFKALWLGVRKSLEPTLPPRRGPLDLPLRCVYVGAVEERKNIPALIAHLETIFGNLPFVLELVGQCSPAQEQLLRSLAARPDILRFRGILSDDALRELMQRVDVTLFPSLSEGFGLPIAEAMQHGHVVFAFNNTSIPEVGGDAVVLAENNDFATWGRELRRLLENPEACAALRERAMERARIFSEEEMKRRFRDYFLEAMRNAGERA